jgi:hypothetical protein
MLAAALPLSPLFSPTAKADPGTIQMTMKSKARKLYDTYNQSYKHMKDNVGAVVRAISDIKTARVGSTKVTKAFKTISQYIEALELASACIDGLVVLVPKEHVPTMENLRIVVGKYAELIDNKLNDSISGGIQRDKIRIMGFRRDPKGMIRFFKNYRMSSRKLHALITKGDLAFPKSQRALMHLNINLGGIIEELSKK